MHIETIRRNKGAVYKVFVKYHGAVKTKTFARKIDAKNWGERTESLMQNSGRFDLTFAQLAEEWLHNHARIKTAPATRITYESQLAVLIPLIGTKSVQDIRHADIERLISEVSRIGHKTNVTINRYLGVVRTILNYGERRGDIMRNPVRKSLFLPETETPFHYWQKAEAMRFMAFAEEKYRGYNRHAALVYTIALNTGMRWGEIAALKWDAVYLGSPPYITVRRSYCLKSRQIRETTKGKTIRHVGINVALLSALRIAEECKPAECDLVVSSSSGEALDNRNFVQRYFQKDIAETKVSPIRFHDLRHTYASLFMMNGGNLFDLQKILGHQDIEMTMRYAHLARDHILDKSQIVVIGTRDNVIDVDFRVRQTGV